MRNTEMDKKCIELYEEMKKGKNKIFEFVDHWVKVKPDFFFLIT